MFRRSWKLTSCLLILSLLVPFVVWADGQGNGPELQVKTTATAQGQTMVDLVMNRPKGLKTFEFTLQYDRAALEITDRDVVKGADVAGWMFEYSINSGNGTVRIAAVHLDGFKSDNQAAIARLTFRLKGSSTGKAFGITDLKGFMDLNKAADMSSRIEADAVASVDGNVIQDIRIDDGHADRTTIKIMAPLSSDMIKLDLEQSAMKKFAESHKSLAVQTPIGSLEMDPAIVGQLAQSRVEIRVEKVEGSEHKPVRKVTILADGKEVESFEGKLKISIPYDKAAQKEYESIIAYRMVDGQKIILPQAALFDGQVIMIAGEAGTFEIGYAEKRFSDTAGHWSQSNIEFVAARELFIGVGNERFAPEQTVTRGMFVTVLGRVLGTPQVDGANVFHDVSTDSYYAPYVAYASQHGIVNGVGGGNFAPDREMTREEMAALLTRFMDHASIESNAGSTGRVFEDQESFSAWASDAIRELRESGIVEGKPGNFFDPQGIVKRAEAAKMIRSFIEMAVR
ncbi:S-layer homology domain-containing protein [Paenibacillus sp. strain BS8-2]